MSVGFSTNEGESFENSETTGRITGSERFIEIDVSAMMSSKPQIHTPPERCRSNVSAWPPHFRRNTNDLRHAFTLGNERISAMQLSKNHKIPTMPRSQVPASKPPTTGRCSV